MIAGNTEGPDTDVWPNRDDRQSQIKAAFASERSADVAITQRESDLLPAGQLLVPVMQVLFAADALERDVRRSP